jgi:hypothetical protein
MQEKPMRSANSMKSLAFLGYYVFDSKSPGPRACEGSSPSPGTSNYNGLTNLWLAFFMKSMDFDVRLIYHQKNLIIHVTKIDIFSVYRTIE